MAKVDILSATSNSSGKKNGNADSASSPKVVIVRLTEAITELFRRTQRLVQVPSMLSEYGHGRAASVRYPLPFNAAVLTIYGKVRSLSLTFIIFLCIDIILQIRFCDYKINVTRTLFLERGNFVQWEAAHELKWAFYEV